MNQTLISIVTPMYNEEECVELFFNTLRHSLKRLGVKYEIICVDDGSTDNTLRLLTEQAQIDKQVKVVALSRNFGKDAAMTAALDYARGDAILPIDADLQDPPELIEEMLNQWRSGYQVVYAKRISRRGDTRFKRSTASWFYKLFNRLSDVKIPDNVGDFRLMDRKVVEAIKQLPEKDRFMKGLFCWPGFSHTVVEFERKTRASGKTKFRYWNLWNYALNGITSFSTFPIRAGVYFGLIVSAISFFYGLLIISKTLLFGVDTPGYASIMVTVLFIGGIQLFFLGIMGEYIGRIYKEVKNRPIYLVSQEIGFDRDDDIETSIS